MKRKLLYGLLTAAVLLCSLPAFAGAARTVPVQVDGVTLSGVSYLENGVTYVPLRSLLDAFGGWEISWDSASQSAVATGSGGSIKASVSQNLITVGGTTYQGSVFLRSGRTYVPLRTLATARGAKVVWDSKLCGAAVTTSGAKYDAVDLYWLSRIISAESQSQPMTGQIAVGDVVLNRVAAQEFPNTVENVVFDRVDGVQFEPVSNGTVYNDPTTQSVEAAKRVLDGASAVGACKYFFNPALSQGTWIRQNRTYYTTIGSHQFYL